MMIWWCFDDDMDDDYMRLRRMMLDGTRRAFDHLGGGVQVLSRLCNAWSSRSDGMVMISILWYDDTNVMMLIWWYGDYMRMSMRLDGTRRAFDHLGRGVQVLSGLCNAWSSRSAIWWYDDDLMMIKLWSDDDMMIWIGQCLVIFWETLFILNKWWYWMDSASIY